MTYVHVQHAPLSLEAERDACRIEDSSMEEAKKRLGLRMYRLSERYGLLHPGASDREFIEWFYGTYLGTGYTYLRSGYAQAHGAVAADHRHSRLAEIGLAMQDGDSYPDILARIAAREPVRRPQKTVTTIQIPAALGPELRAIRDGVSESDRLNGPEAVARLMLSVGKQEPPMRAALLDTEGTGRGLVDALVYAVDERSDYRPVLKRQPCVRCNSRVGIELHHQMVDANERHRTHNYLVPLCRACHQARPGDDTAIHAQKFEDIKQDADYWRKAFMAVSDAAEATRPNVPPPAAEEAEDPDSAYQKAIGADA